MSHTSTISAITITDIPALRAAIKELKSNNVNCELLENAVPRAYYSGQQGMGEAPYVIALRDSKYDVGLYRNQEDNGYEPRTDLWQGQVSRVLGAKATGNESAEQAALGKLFNMYAVHATIRAANRKGMRVTRNNRSDGSVQIQLRAA